MGILLRVTNICEDCKNFLAYGPWNSRNDLPVKAKSVITHIYSWRCSLTVSFTSCATEKLNLHILSSIFKHLINLSSEFKVDKVSWLKITDVSETVSVPNILMR
jgi:hypothetical protein